MIIFLGPLQNDNSFRKEYRIQGKIDERLLLVKKRNELTEQFGAKRIQAHKFLMKQIH